MEFLSKFFYVFKITLSTAPTAVKAAASCYIDLIVKESDNNVKLIVLDRLIAMKVSSLAAYNGSVKMFRQTELLISDIFDIHHRVLSKLQDSPQHEKILQEVVMYILRVLSSPDLEVRRKTLSLAMDLVTSRNVEEMVLVLKKVKIIPF